jgi:uncharacterized membrane protein YqiK
LYFCRRKRKIQFKRTTKKVTAEPEELEKQVHEFARVETMRSIALAEAAAQRAVRKPVPLAKEHAVLQSPRSFDFGLPQIPNVAKSPDGSGRWL